MGKVPVAKGSKARLGCCKARVASRIAVVGFKVLVIPICDFVCLYKKFYLEMRIVL